MKLEIGPVIAEAEVVAERIGRELPGHPGLLRTARQIAEAARDAERVSRRIHRVVGLHRLPAVFLLLAVGAVATWTWWHFFHTSNVVIAVSDTDAVDLGRELGRRIQFHVVRTPGSRASLDKLVHDEVDLAFVQGGVAIPPDLPRVELPSPEIVLLFLRPQIARLDQIRIVLTSTEGQGSHTLAQRLVHLWGGDGTVSYRHDWNRLGSDRDYRVPPEVDAVLVVKDPLDEGLAAVSRRLLADGFRLAPVDLGAAALGMRFLRPITMEPGFLDAAGPIPPEPVDTYLVTTYLVARDDLGPRKLAAARRLVDATSNRIDPGTTLSNVGEASEVLQGVEAFLSILVYIGLAFLTLLGVDIVLYRRRFHELNSLISLISMHQAGKDVAGFEPAVQAEHIAYLGFCSDLLGLIAIITGYYAQENSSLLYNKMLEIIPQRCDGLKVNIQVKILHALVGPVAGPAAPSDDQS